MHRVEPRKALVFVLNSEMLPKVHESLDLFPENVETFDDLTEKRAMAFATFEHNLLDATNGWLAHMFDTIGTFNQLQVAANAADVHLCLMPKTSSLLQLTREEKLSLLFLQQHLKNHYYTLCKYSTNSEMPVTFTICPTSSQNIADYSKQLISGNYRSVDIHHYLDHKSKHTNANVVPNTTLHQHLYASTLISGMTFTKNIHYVLPSQTITTNLSHSRPVFPLLPLTYSNASAAPTPPDFSQSAAAAAAEPVAAPVVVSAPEPARILVSAPEPVSEPVRNSELTPAQLTQDNQKAPTEANTEMTQELVAKFTAELDLIVKRAATHSTAVSSSTPESTDNHSSEPMEIEKNSAELSDGNFTPASDTTLLPKSASTQSLGSDFLPGLEGDDRFMTPSSPTSDSGVDNELGAPETDASAVKPHEIVDDITLALKTIVNLKIWEEKGYGLTTLYQIGSKLPDCIRTLRELENPTLESCITNLGKKLDEDFSSKWTSRSQTTIRFLKLMKDLRDTQVAYNANNDSDNLQPRLLNIISNYAQGELEESKQQLAKAYGKPLSEDDQLGLQSLFVVYPHGLSFDRSTNLSSSAAAAQPTTALENTTSNAGVTLQRGSRQ